MGDEACILFPFVFNGKKNNSTIPNTHSLFFLAAELEWKSTFVFYHEKEGTGEHQRRVRNYERGLHTYYMPT